MTVQIIRPGFQTIPIMRRLPKAEREDVSLAGKSYAIDMSKQHSLMCMGAKGYGHLSTHAITSWEQFETA